MDRALTWAVVMYAGLSVAHWSHVAHLLNTPPPPDCFLCGNAFSDPFLFLANTITPLAAACVVALAWRRIRGRRRPIFPLLIPPLFLGTTLALVFEAFWMRDFGVPVVDAIWWLPWRWLGP